MAFIDTVKLWCTCKESSGVRSDSHGSNHLTDNGSVGSAAGKIGNAASFTAANQSLSRPDNADLSMGTGVKWMFAAWVKIDTIEGSNNPAIVSKNNAAEYLLDVNFNAYTIRLFTGNTQRLTTSATLTPDQWHFVAAWYDGSAYRVSIDDGTPAVGGSGDTPDGTGAFMLGGRAVSGVYAWQGMIDEAVLCKGDTTDDDRTWLYNGGAGRTYTDLYAVAASSRPVLSSPFLIGDLR